MVVSLNILKAILEELADVPFSFSMNWIELLMSPNADSDYLSSFTVYLRAWNQVCVINCYIYSDCHIVGLYYIC